MNKSPLVSIISYLFLEALLSSRIDYLKRETKKNIHENSSFDQNSKNPATLNTKIMKLTKSIQRADAEKITIISSIHIFLLVNPTNEIL